MDSAGAAGPVGSATAGTAAIERADAAATVNSRARRSMGGASGQVSDGRVSDGQVSDGQVSDGQVSG
ncbi:hypothetical protein GCM10010404_66640 [Nonomuraea africana]